MSVKVKRNNVDDPGKNASCKVVVWNIKITSVICPNSGISFTTRSENNENIIRCIADIKPDSLDTVYNSKIARDVVDDSDVNGDSGNPNDPPDGDDVTWTDTPVSPAPSGRDYPLNYKIIASLTIGNETVNSETAVVQDEQDKLREQYIDMSKACVPERSELYNETTFNSSYPEGTYHLSFSEAQCNGGTYCGSHTYLYVDTVVSVFRDVRNQYGSSITVTSCYRCPRYNAHIGGAVNSYHIHGDAFDFDTGSTDANWNIAIAAAQAGVDKNRILLYKDSTISKTLKWLEDNGYNATNLPSGWSGYDFGHVTTQ